MSKSALIQDQDDSKIRLFIETLTPQELVQLFLNVVTPEYIGLIAAELKKRDTANIPDHIERDPEFHTMLWKEVNSPEHLVAISDQLAKEVEQEVAEMMDEYPTLG